MTAYCIWVLVFPVLMAGPGADIEAERSAVA